MKLSFEQKVEMSIILKLLPEVRRIPGDEGRIYTQNLENSFVHCLFKDMNANRKIALPSSRDLCENYEIVNILSFRNMIRNVVNIEVDENCINFFLDENHEINEAEVPLVDEEGTELVEELEFDCCQNEMVKVTDEKIDCDEASGGSEMNGIGFASVETQTEIKFRSIETQTEAEYFVTEDLEEDDPDYLNYNPLPYLKIWESKINANQLAAKLRVDKELWFEVYDLAGLCFNCKNPKHISVVCRRLPRGTFCGACGTPGVIKSHCPRCHFQDYNLNPPLQYVGYGVHRFKSRQPR